MPVIYNVKRNKNFHMDLVDQWFLLRETEIRMEETVGLNSLNFYDCGRNRAKLLDDGARGRKEGMLYRQGQDPLKNLT